MITDLASTLNGLNPTLLLATVVIPVFLALMLIGDGLRSIRWAKNRLPFFRADFTDGAFLSGQQTGLLGVTYTTFGIVFLLAVGVGFWLL